jgi:DNA-damage-inducible protein J
MTLRLGGAMLLNTEVRSRVEKGLKTEASKVLQSCGMDLSTAIRLFLRQVVEEKGLPFAIKQPNSQTIAAIHEARKISGRFKTAKEIFHDLEEKG